MQINGKVKLVIDFVLVGSKTNKWVKPLNKEILLEKDHGRLRHNIKVHITHNPLSADRKTNKNKKIKMHLVFVELLQLRILCSIIMVLQ